MPTTTGQVLQLSLSETIPGACFFIGTSLQFSEVLFIRLRASDAARVRDFKKSMIALLAKAQQAGYPVEVQHTLIEAEITIARFTGFDISPVGTAIRGDFYSVTGSNIPAEAELVFESDTAIVTVTPDLVRPHLVVVVPLPVEVPLGRNTVRLQAPGWSSQAVPVDVADGRPPAVRVLHSGPPKVRPYTIVLVANTAIEDEAGGTFTSDPVLANRVRFYETVRFCLRNMFAVTEDLLRQGHIDASIRLVTIFDDTAAAIEANSLVQEVAPNRMEPKGTKTNSFVERHHENADIVFVINGSTTHFQATSQFTTDYAAGPSTGYTFDGTARVHGHLPRIPGICTLSIVLVQNFLTALHEFCHAASDFNNGKVHDLYVDGTARGFLINKKFRADSADAIPNIFATYEGTDYPSDQNRDGIGYGANWTSFHPALIDATRPNIMDDRGLAFDDPELCRLDRLTYDWLVDRLWAKVLR